MHLVPEVPGGLRVQPELRTRAKGSLEPERGVRRHASLPLHNLVHALKGYTNRPRELNLGNSKRAKEFLEQQLPGVWADDALEGGP
jgi:hypothetical protein